MNVINRTGPLVIAVGLLGGTLVLSQTVPPKSPVGQQLDEKLDRDEWMHAKLATSQEIFAGLTGGDFQKIEDNARRLLVFNFLQEWATVDRGLKDHSEYQGQLNAFEFATKELVRTAQRKDVDAALAAYIKMSESCVRCHQAVRDVLPPARAQ